MEFLVGLLGFIFFITSKFFLPKLIDSLFSSLYGWIKESLYMVFGYGVVTVLSYVIAGVILGGISLAIIPQHITPNIQIRLTNLVVTPLIIGVLVNLSSNIKFYKDLARFDSVNFISGYTFALAMACMRFIFAK